ncbi:hypothetical protein VTJ83DRAFT_1725 [Remersonia thermophila]|uniref:DUF7728 domain-containing protein n=1 Tax=Remersonia thermophila TaxID=72144 RepID=A0ABR4DI91_9PEZI
MLLKPIAAAATLLALPGGSLAFLLPPQVTDAEARAAADVANAAIAPLDAQSRVVRLDCPGCPVLLRGRHGRPFQAEIDLPTRLELSFSIEQTHRGDRLVVNGFELLPLSNPPRRALVAPQVIVVGEEDKGRQQEKEEEQREDVKEKRHWRGHGHGEHKKHGVNMGAPLPQRLGYGLHVEMKGKNPTSGFDEVEVELQIVQVGPVFVDGVPNVRVTLLHTTTPYGNGRLLLGDIVTGVPKKLGALAVGAPADHPECTGALCRWLAAVREKLQGLKGSLKTFGHCHGGKAPAGHGMGGHAAQTGDDRFEAAATEAWRAPYQERSWGKLLEYVGRHILLPVFVGIVAGVSISLLGMAIGTAVVALWRIFRCRRRGASTSTRSRRHRRQSRAHRKAVHEEAAAAEEKSGLMADHQDLPPPPYTDDKEAASRV